MYYERYMEVRGKTNIRMARSCVSYGERKPTKEGISNENWRRKWRRGMSMMRVKKDRRKLKFQKMDSKDIREKKMDNRYRPLHDLRYDVKPRRSLVWIFTDISKMSLIQYSFEWILVLSKLTFMQKNTKSKSS